VACSISPPGSSSPPWPPKCYPTCGSRDTCGPRWPGSRSESPCCSPWAPTAAAWNPPPRPHLPPREGRDCRSACLTAVGIDLLLDGLLVGLGVTLGSNQGIILTIALTLEILFLGLAVSTELREAGIPRFKAAGVAAALGLATAVGAIGGAAVLGGAGHTTLAAVLAFGAAALLYLVVEELLVEAHEEAETPILSAMFFVGFLALFVLVELGG